jgi:uncharacterized protein (TIGR02145 family)
MLIYKDDPGYFPNSFQSHYGIGDCNNVSGSTIIGNSNKYSENVWIMLTSVIQQSGNSQLYINGVLDTSIVGLPYLPCNSPTTQLRIGYGWDGDPRWFKGKLDDIAIYNRALTQSEITQLYTATPAPTEVAIGTQTWTTKNLDVATYSDGTIIPQVTNPTQWANLTTGAWCYYNNDADTGATFGRLYNWYAVAGIWDEASKTDANQRKKLAPTGYHVPSDAEWTTLTTYLEGDNVAGGKMKATGTALWNSPNQDATNSSGFAGLPGGFRNYIGTFNNIGSLGYWWSSSEDYTADAWFRFLNYNYGSAYRNDASKDYGFSVRCLRD